MKILVLGNGFDLDHNLPTSYMDFLKFCNYLLEGTEKSFNELKPIQKEYADNLKTTLSKIDINDFSLSFNHLLNYFVKKVETNRENWIDFEHEIKIIVHELKVMEYELKQSNRLGYDIDKKHKIHKILIDFGFDDFEAESWNEDMLSTLHRILCRNLNEFTLVLEYYISAFINIIPVNGYSPDVHRFYPDRAITFNYSNTYERGDYFGLTRWDIDHVHGIAVANNYTPNIILGITTDDKNLENYYVEFEKYFQRITRRTGNKYKKWLQQAKDNNEEIEVMFFGHSLDAADSDIIKDLIYHDKSFVKIYYYDDKSYQQIVINLVEILTKKDLMDFVFGEKPKIEFIQQQKHYYPKLKLKTKKFLI